MRRAQTQLDDTVIAHNSTVEELLTASSTLCGQGVIVGVVARAPPFLHHRHSEHWLYISDAHLDAILSPLVSAVDAAVDALLPMVLHNATQLRCVHTPCPAKPNVCAQPTYKRHETMDVLSHGL